MSSFSISCLWTKEEREASLLRIHLTKASPKQSKHQVLLTQLVIRRPGTVPWCCYEMGWPLATCGYLELTEANNAVPRSHEPHYKCSRATCGYWPQYWTEQTRAFPSLQRVLLESVALEVVIRIHLHPNVVSVVFAGLVPR